MKRRITLITLLALTLTSCELANTINVTNSPTKAFTFHLKGDFSTCYNDLTKASVRLEENNSAGITDIWVLDYADDGTLLQEVHQTSTQEDFGQPSMNLTYGSHSIKFIASKGTEPVKTANAISWTKVSDTFVLDYPVEVKASTNGNRAPELKRAISGVTLINTDAVPANAKEIQITVIKRLSALTLPALTGSNEDEYTNTLPFYADDAGVKNLEFSTYTLCPSNDAFTIDVSVKVVAKDGSTISEFSIEEVELKKNRRTTLTGAVFNRSEKFPITIDDTWDTANGIEF